MRCCPPEQDLLISADVSFSLADTCLSQVISGWTRTHTWFLFFDFCVCLFVFSKLHTTPKMVTKTVALDLVQFASLSVDMNVHKGIRQKACSLHRHLLTNANIHTHHTLMPKTQMHRCTHLITLHRHLHTHIVYTQTHTQTHTHCTLGPLVLLLP